MKVLFRTRLQQALAMRNMKASELARRTGLSKASISQYVNGVCEAKQTALYHLAKELDVNEAWLMGYDVPADRLPDRIREADFFVTLEDGRILTDRDFAELILHLPVEGKLEVCRFLEEMQKKYEQHEE